MHLLALRDQRVPGEGHRMLKADQPAKPPEMRRHDAEGAAIPLPPETALDIGRHEFAVLADECTSSLDLITQKDVLNIFRQLSQEMGTGILFISHDLLTVSSLCHRIAILRSGELVEVGLTNEILKRPAHPYTKQLVSALPVPEALTAR